MPSAYFRCSYPIHGQSKVAIAIKKEYIGWLSTGERRGANATRQDQTTESKTTNTPLRDQKWNNSMRARKATKGPVGVTAALCESIMTNPAGYVLLGVAPALQSKRNKQQDNATGYFSSFAT